MAEIASAELQVDQDKCEGLILHYRYSDGTAFDKPMILDGTPRVIFDEPEFRTVEAFWLQDDQIEMTADLYNLTNSSLHKLKGTLGLDQDGNLIENKTISSADGEPLFSVGTVFFQSALNPH